MNCDTDIRKFSRYEVNPEYVQKIASAGLRFVGEDVDGERMEIVELDNHPYFVGLQAHPEFTSKPLEPSPPYLGLILASIGKLEQYLEKGCKITSDMLENDSDDDFLSEEFQKVLLEDERNGFI